MKQDQKNGKILHGNDAKIDPQKKMDGLYIANTVTMSDRRDHETPIPADDGNVEYARKFSQENKK